MARLSDIASSGYFGKEDFEGKPNATIIRTIAGVEDGELPDGKPQRVLSFEDEEKKLGLNVTRWHQVADACGLDPKSCDDSEFIGNEIEIFFDPTVMMGGKRVGGIRVRKPTKAAPARKSPPQPRQPASAPLPEDVPDDDGAPPEESAPPRMTKLDAWAAYQRRKKAEHPNITPPQISQAWKDDVEAVKTQRGYGPDKFTEDDWGQIGSGQIIPF